MYQSYTQCNSYTLYNQWYNSCKCWISFDINGNINVQYIDKTLTCQYSKRSKLSYRTYILSKTFGQN